MVNVINENSNYLAYAAPCNINSFNNRPNIGILSINQNNFVFGKTKISTFRNTITHELMHVLIMSPMLFRKFHNKSHDEVV